MKHFWLISPDEEDMIAVWKILFSKLDALSRDNEKLRLQLGNLENRIESLEHSSKAPQNAWISILRRQDGSENFYRNWSEYKRGFGNAAHGEFFIGLDRLHALTNNSTQELLIILKDWNDEMRYAFYDYFKIGSEKEFYSLKLLGAYSGDAGDALRVHQGRNFSTYDQWNDTGSNCATRWKGAWWYAVCYESHLTGVYRPSDNFTQPGVGWLKWKSEYSLKYAEMKIRLKIF
ncbi:ryncolin-4-like [Musca vetustissima]|uniref:ryncolin-4-like n=1 Tax=Musca vetustissima TaxID=27455 RepID=UPI002AB6C6AF|nr:ryncolin-4-like [Musca vetustissima]